MRKIGYWEIPLAGCSPGSIVPGSIVSLIPTCYSLLRLTQTSEDPMLKSLTRKPSVLSKATSNIILIVLIRLEASSKEDFKDPADKFNVNEHLNGDREVTI